MGFHFGVQYLVDKPCKFLVVIGLMMTSIGFLVIPFISYDLNTALNELEIDFDLVMVDEESVLDDYSEGVETLGENVDAYAEYVGKLETLAEEGRLASEESKEVLSKIDELKIEYADLQEEASLNGQSLAKLHAKSGNLLDEMDENIRMAAYMGRLNKFLIFVGFLFLYFGFIWWAILEGKAKKKK